MSTHQIIYTSCKRGISGVNDGQQIYSHDAAFQENDRDKVKSLFAYQHPALAPGVSMTEELARTMPQSFTYRQLDNGMCALALNTYLGRDYMGSAGRFGNHLSHVVMFDPGDSAHYPAEYFGSALLRGSISFEEVNNPERPDYLPAPVLWPGSAVDMDAAAEFLSVGDRMSVYKSMLCAMLAFDSARKRVVICDAPEHIIYWIAALHYALPLKNALTVNFTTYDYNPSLSPARICGVMPGGTRFSTDSSQHHFVFDLLRSQIPALEPDPEFSEFIDAAMSFSHESLRDFHGFLDGSFRYGQADSRLYDGYTLYAIMTDSLGTCSDERLEGALRFAEEFADAQMTADIVRQLLFGNRLFFYGSRRQFMTAVNYVMSAAPDLDQEAAECLKELLVARIMVEFRDVGVQEAAFQDMYRTISRLCAGHRFSLAAQLLQQENRQRLMGVLSGDTESWKLAFIIQVISDYVKDRSVPVNMLLPEEPLGQLYYGIVRTVYGYDRSKGAYLTERILQEFTGLPVYFVNMALNLEGVVLDLPDGGREVETMWQYFDRSMMGPLRNSMEMVMDIFKKEKRHDRLYSLFVRMLNEAADAGQCETIFRKYYSDYLSGGQRYAAGYEEQAMTAYYEKLGTWPSSETVAQKRRLFEMLAPAGTDVPFADRLVGDLTRSVPLDRLNDRDSRLVKMLVDYHHIQRGGRVRGKLLLLMIGKMLSEAPDEDQLCAAIYTLAELMNCQRADLTQMNEYTLLTFFDWILPNPCKLCSRTETLFLVRDMFVMPSIVEERFYHQCAKHYLKRSKGGKDTELMREFVGTVLCCSCVESRRTVGRLLGKLSIAGMEKLEKAVMDRYCDDAQIMEHWMDIRMVSAPGNPVSRAIRRFLPGKRKK